MSTMVLPQLERALVNGRECDLTDTRPRGVTKTPIEWCDYSANPIRAIDPKTRKVGWHCVKVSPGCAHCYAEKINMRLGTGHPFTAQGASGVELFLDEGVLLRLLTFKPRGPFVGVHRPSVFLCDMCDLFDERVDPDWIIDLLAVVALRPDVDFIVLTKRADRLSDMFRDKLMPVHISFAMNRMEALRRGNSECDEYEIGDAPWPLTNLFAGVSCENQDQYDKRVGLLVNCDAPNPWISHEPALGPIDYESEQLCGVISGGESGSDARKPQPHWFQHDRDQLCAAGVPFFFKQWGHWAPCGEFHMRPVGKKAAGATLDGREHRQLAWGGAP